MTIRILIADDHSLVRHGLKALLSAQSDIQVVAEASDGAEAVERSIATHPDIVVMDLAMPKYAGLPAIMNIRRTCPNTQVLILTMHDDPSYLHSVLAAGGAGYVVKSAADTELLSAIRAVSQGRSSAYLSTKERVHSDLGEISSPGCDSSASLLASLSEREREVLVQIARGYTSKEVASCLKISPKSVETYRARVMQKLGFRNRADLVRLALDLDLLKSS